MIICPYREIIDIHSHIFPDSIAPGAIESIGSFYRLPMRGKGTTEELKYLSLKAGISISVVSSTATSPHQVKTINNYLASVCSQYPNFISFGTMHPEFPFPQREIDRIISMGIKGIKLHPDFQKYNIDHPLMLPIYEAIEGRLPVLFHIGDNRMDYSSPLRLVHILDRFPRLTAIAAHLGGYMVWDDWGSQLLGRDVYIDTSSALMFLNRKKAVQIIRSHGVDKVLYGTDYPMWIPEYELRRFLSLGLTQEENMKILSANAKRVLGLEQVISPPKSEDSK